MAKYRIKDFEDEGFSVKKLNERGEYELELYTPAGEDWILYLHKLDDIEEFYEYFDPEEELYHFLRAKWEGTLSGVPEMPELWDDQVWKQEILKKIVSKK